MRFPTLTYTWNICNWLLRESQLTRVTSPFVTVIMCGGNQSDHSVVPKCRDRGIATEVGICLLGLSRAKAELKPRSRSWLNNDVKATLGGFPASSEKFKSSHKV